MSSWFCHQLFHQVLLWIWYFIVVAVKSTGFWNMTPGRLVNITRQFGGTCCHHLMDWRVSQSSNSDAASFLLVSCLALSTAMKLELIYSSETSVNFYRTMSQKREFITSVIVITLYLIHVVLLYASTVYL